MVSRSFAEFTKSTKFRESNLMTTGLCVAAVSSVVIVAISVCLLARRRSRYRYTNLQTAMGSQEKVRPTEVKPVSSFKNAAGPGGLKKSPSPMHSPENADIDSSACKEIHPKCGRTEPNLSECVMEVNQQKYAVIDWKEDEGVEEEIETAYEVKADEKTSTCGKLRYRLIYDFERNTLSVHIISASELVPKGMCYQGEKVMLDPYVKLQLLPEKQHKIKTRVVRNTSDPVYDEEFVFYGINYNQLQNTTLHFAVIAFDRFLRDKIIGEALCPLSALNLKESNKAVDISIDLVNRSLKFQHVKLRGEVLVSLCFRQATNKICVVVLKAQNLPTFEITGFADPYVKIYLLINGSKIAKKKTHVKKRTVSPVYNEAFIFDLPEANSAVMDKISVEILVMDWDRITKNEVMGRVEIGPHACSPIGRSHWEEAKSNPWKQVAHWHQLKP
uniref:C2 domain-containing protein n=1 Tax=Trichuris muris TaxID=70415 RepID=A0A5S6Q9G8_TRIMR